MPDLWTRVLGDLRLQMTKQTYDTWLRGSVVVDESPDALVVGVKSPYGVDWLSNRLAATVERVARNQAGRPVSVRFVLSPTSAAIDDDDDAGPLNPDEPIVEAVQERSVNLQRGGRALSKADFYIRIKTAFREKALAMLKGAPLSVFLCLALHVDADGVSAPGVERIMRETGYSRSVVCNALDELVTPIGLVTKRASFRGNDEYIVNGYAWFGSTPAPALWEQK